MKEQKFSRNKLYINLGDIAENYKSIKKFVNNPKIECAANLKANTYGLGLIPIMRCLSTAGCNKFFVTTLDEAIELRNSISVTDEIYVLHGINHGEEDEFAKYHIIPVLNNKAQFEIFNNYCRKKNKIFDAVLNIDTCSNQFGFPVEEAINLAEQGLFKQKLNIHFLMSQPTYNEEQLALIHNLKNLFAIPVSFADSKSFNVSPDYYFDIIRLGIILYGGVSTKFPLRNSISLTSSIIQINELSEDIFIANNQKISRNTILATIPIGYAAGLNRSHKCCYINDYPAPVIGRISMDITVLDVTNVPKNFLFLGAQVEVFGDNFSIEEMAKDANTSPHDILMSLSTRIEKIYI